MALLFIGNLSELHSEPYTVMWILKLKLVEAIATWHLMSTGCIITGYSRHLRTTQWKNCSHRCKCNYKYNDHYCTATATIFSFSLTSFLFLCCWRLDHIRKRERMEINGNYRHDALAVVQPPVSKCWSQDSLAYQFINFSDFCLPELYFYTHFLKTLSYIVYIAYRVNYARLYKLMTVSGHWVSKWFSILKIEFLVVNKYVFNPQMLYIVHGDWNEISLYKS